MTLKEILRANRLWLIAYLVLLTASTVTLCGLSKAEIFCAINSWHSPVADICFKWISEMGTFAFIGPVCLICFFLSVRHGLTACASAALSSLGTQFGKRVVWPVSPRPKILMQELLADNPDLQFHLVDGVHLHSSHSFPSGHTTGAFGLFCVLALIARKPVWKMVWLMMAVLVAYARMYLSQHFLIDVTVGSFIGTLSALLCCWWMSRYRKPWMDRGLYSFFRKG